MKKAILNILILVSPALAWAQDQSGRASSNGATIGRYLGYFIVPVILLIGIRVLVRRLRK